MNDLTSYSHLSRFAEWNPSPAVASNGWRIEQRLGPSVLYGANGLAFGLDGRLYIAQYLGNRISALSADGSLETIIPYGGRVIAPDDLAFDSIGRMFITDNALGAIWMREQGGELKVIADSMPFVNGIAVHGNRIFVNECRLGGNLHEVYPDRARPRLMADGLAAPNAMAVGPDGRLYFPLVFAGQVWSIDLDGGSPRLVLDGLQVATAVKFAADGRLVALSSATGIITFFNLRTGERSIIKARPGLDNLTFDHKQRLIVSYFTDGAICEVLGDGQERIILPRGFLRPTDVAVSAGGNAFVADGAIKAEAPDQKIGTYGSLVEVGSPGHVRGISHDPAGSDVVVTTADGKVVSYNVNLALAETISEGLNAPTGIEPLDHSSFLIAETGAGRVIKVERGRVLHVICQLDEPAGLAKSVSGRIFVTQTSAGRVVEVIEGTTRLVTEALKAPSGIVVYEDYLVVVDLASRSLVKVDMELGTIDVLVSALPIEPPPGRNLSVAPVLVIDNPTIGAGDNAIDAATAAHSPFVGLALDPLRKAILIACDGDGSIMSLSTDT